MSHTISILEVPEKDHVRVVYLSGEIDDTNLGKIQEQLDPLFEHDTISIIIFHLQDLQFINSKVIQYFASSHTNLHESGKKLLLSEGNEHILDILNLVGFTNLVEHYSSLDEAIKSLDL